MDPILNKLDSIWIGFLKVLPQLGLALGVVLLTWLASSLVSKGIGRLFGTSLRRSLHDLLDRLLSVGIWVTGFMIAATIAFPSLSAEELIATIGLGSIAVGFAFKDIFENFFAGILILFREPFRIGDYVECNDIKGWVKRITIRDTHIHQTTGERVVMPNAMLFKNPVYVMTDKDIRRTTVICGIAYGEDVDEGRDVIYKAVEGCESVHGDEPVEIFAQNFGDSSIDYEVTWWTGSSPREIRKSRDEVVAAVKRALDEAGIEIPFPYRTLTFKEPLEILRGRNGDQDGAESGETDRDGRG